VFRIFRKDTVERLVKDRELLKKQMTPWLFLAIPLTIYLLILVYPLIRSILLSFTNWSGMSGSPLFVGIDNYKYLFSHGALVTALKNNLLWLVLTVPIPTVIGFILALFLQEETRINILLRFMFYIPMVLSTAVIAIIWMRVYEPTHGMLTELLGLLHLPSLTRSFLTRPDTAIIAISVAGIWHWIGFPLVIYLAALQDIPQDILESAELDGATRFQKVRYGIIPLVQHATTIVVALGAILSLKVFDMIYLMTGGYYKNDVIGTLLWRTGFDQFRVGRASAIAVIDLLVIAVLVVPYVRWQRRSGKIEL